MANFVFVAEEGKEVYFEDMVLGSLFSPLEESGKKYLKIGHDRATANAFDLDGGLGVYFKHKLRCIVLDEDPVFVYQEPAG